MGLFDGTILERPVLCDRCQKEIKVCTCAPEIATEPDVAPDKQRLTVRVEKRKNGKAVTTINGFSCPKSQISKLFSELKNHLGAGGSCDETSIEVQGQHSEKVREFLSSKAYKLSKAT